MPGLKIAARKDGDMNIWAGDNVELLIETQSHAYYQIAIAPNGCVVDLDRKDGRNTLWHSQIEVAVERGDDHWTIEARLPVVGEEQGEQDPLNYVAGTHPSETLPFYFNVCRQRVRGDATERSVFAPTGQDTFHFPMKFGELIVR